MRFAIPVLLATWAPCAALAAEKPNVVLLLLDDMGHGDMGCTGATDIRTPHMDSLAVSGIRFTNFYAAAPLCTPSRVALMTGQHPARIISTTQNIASGPGVEGMSGAKVTVAELARSRGYATGIVGKWHLGSSDATSPNGQGFESFFGNLGSCIDPYSHKYYASEPWYHDLFRNREEVFEGGTHTTELFTREALRFIDENRERPFLLYVAYNVPHYPMAAQPQYMKEYAHLKGLRREYAAMVAGADASVGAILGRLRELKLRDRTFVFLSSDHGAPAVSKREEGGGSNAPFRECKRSVFDGGVHVPGIVSWPGTIPEGQVRGQLASMTDVFPTVAEMIGAELPDGVVDGRSWWPMIRDATAPGHERLFFEWANQHAVRQGKWKLVENGLVDQASGRENRAKGADAVFLSNVENDPGESRNLAAEHPDLVRELTELHRNWLSEVVPGKHE